MHWGFELAKFGGSSKLRILWGVTPALWSCAATIAFNSNVLGSTGGERAGAMMLVPGFALAYYADAAYCARGMTPLWYMALRRPLTIAAVGSLCVSIVAKPGMLHFGGGVAEKRQDD